MEQLEPRHPAWQIWLLRLLLFCPPVVFYVILWKNVINLPIADDYHEVLDFTNRWTQLHGFWPKLLQIVTFQQNEYKLFIENSVIAAQYGILGHIDFRSLALLANFFILGTFFVLLSLPRTKQMNERDRLLVLLPISLLLFQLQYASALNWAMAFQNLAVILFSVLTVALLCNTPRFWFWSASASMILAIAASGSGFMTVPVALFILAQRKQWKHLVAWIAMISAVGALYFYRYDFHSSQAAPGASVTRSFARVNPLYALSFMGSSFARYESAVPSILFGLVLCGVLVLAIRRRYDRENPAVFYLMVVIVITAVGVSGMRSDFGIIQSLASRYRIYSNLLLLFSYIFLADSVFAKDRRSLSHRGLFAAVLLFCFAFWGASTSAGARLLAGRRKAIVHDMAAWQNPGAAANGGASLGEDSVILKRQLAAGIYKPDTASLQRSIELGVYNPPKQTLP